MEGEQGRAAVESAPSLPGHRGRAPRVLSRVGDCTAQTPLRRDGPRTRQPGVLTAACFVVSCPVHPLENRINYFRK